MEYNEKYELVINRITAGEYTGFRETYEDYKQIAYLCLDHKGCYLFEDEILSHYSEGVTLEAIFSQNKDRFRQMGNPIRNGKREKAWYDLWSEEIVVKEDDFFDFFFAYKIRNINLFEIDNYLSYHLEYTYENNRLKFLRFLTIMMRTHEKTILKPEIVETVNEWIKATETKPELSGTENSENIKGRRKREAGDNLTSLTLVQTALLIQFMKEEKIILKGDNELNFTQIGKAFNILTGYSEHSLRQQLGIKGEINGMAKEDDYKELHKAIVNLEKLIETKIRKK